MKNVGIGEKKIVLKVPVQTSDAQTSDSTNVGRTNVGPVQTSDQYKRWTSTNFGLVQTSDQYKRWTGTLIRKNVGLGRF